MISPLNKAKVTEIKTNFQKPSRPQDGMLSVPAFYGFSQPLNAIWKSVKEAQKCRTIRAM